jgi:signal transduction histidine kinase
VLRQRHPEANLVRPVEILVRNLISNGVKYSFDASCFEDGEAGKFLVRFDQRQIRLTFINFGVPISLSEISTGSLFDRETRGGGANDRGRVGKGVGLYLVKRVVDLHNAEITVRSQLMNPGGSQQFARNEFEIRFPK